MSQFLVTGASGLLGGNFLFELPAEDSAVALYYTHAIVPQANIQTQQINISNPNDLRQLRSHYKPDVFIHTAALTEVDFCEQHPDLAHKVHVEATEHLADWAKDLGARFLYISTDSVYDGLTGGYKESDIPRPLTTYAKTKLQGERAVAERLEDYLILRTNLYGWSLWHERTFAEWILSGLEHEKELTMFEDVIFNPLRVNELVRILQILAKSEDRGILHLAGPEVLSKYEFAVKMANCFGCSGASIKRIRLADKKLAAPRPRNTSLNIDALTKILGQAPEGVSEGLQQWKNAREDGYVEKLRAWRKL